MRRILLVLLVGVLSGPVFASASDSLDVVHYWVHLDTIRKAPVRTLHAHTRLRVASLVNGLDRLSLDLLGLTVDSAFVDGQAVTWSHDDTLLVLHSPQILMQGDTIEAEVWYHGTPTRDPSFGGFYFQGDYVFNIGVALEGDPHNYGRVWVPCKDNFTDRAYWDFYIRTDSSDRAVCNGTLQSDSTHADGSITWHWSLADPVPTYLAGFALGPYLLLEDEFLSISGDTIPYHLYVRPQDSAQALSQSSQLKQGLTGMEMRFGPYRWERLGYVMVVLPLQGSIGAMEHATNIAFPTIILPLGQSYETIWAHEAAHAWWGNLVTCEAEGEMWLNEGWATFCEAIFMETVYGQSDYRSYLLDMQADVLRRAHMEDDGYQALSGMPHAQTYSRTTYNKGALVAHTLRGQMGDSLFFGGLRAYLDARAFRHVHSDSLQKSLEQYSGMDLQAFFDGWVAQPGFPHFAVDSMVVTPQGPGFQVDLHLRQRLRGATQWVDSVWIQVRFTGAALQQEDRSFWLHGGQDQVSLNLPFEPLAYHLDPDAWLADATTDAALILTQTGTSPLARTYAEVTVDSLPQSTYLRVSHHWLEPDSTPLPVAGMRLSASRYWSVSGTFPPGFAASARFSYNGRNNSNGWLDHTWLTDEDSIVMLYRPGPGHDWELEADAQVLIGSPVDLVGAVRVTDLRPGEYTLAHCNCPVGVAEAPQELAFRIYPNPPANLLKVELPPDVEGGRLKVLDMQGKILVDIAFEAGARTLELDTSTWSAATYLVAITTPSGARGIRRLVIQ